MKSLVLLRDRETLFSRRQCVSPVIACGQSRGDLCGIAATQAKRFTWSVSVASDPHFPPGVSPGSVSPPASAKFHTLYRCPGNTCRAIFIINGNDMKWIVWRHAFIAKWLPLSGSTRLVMRKRKGRVSVGLYKQRKRRGQSDMLTISSHVCRIHSSMVDILSCSFVQRYIERFTFSLWWDMYRRCKMKKWFVSALILLHLGWDYFARDS